MRDKSNKEVQVALLRGDEDIVGGLDIKLKKGKDLKHQGIKIEFIGRIETT